MPFINFTNIITVLLAVILFGLIIFLGKELHKSALPAIMLFAFLIILSMPCYGINAYTKHKQRSISCNSKKYSS